MILRVDQDEYVLHAFASRAFDQFLDVRFVGVLAAERMTPVLDVRNAELFFGQCRIVEVLQLSAADPAMKCIFLDADLKSVWIALFGREERWHQGDSTATNGGFTNESTPTDGGTVWSHDFPHVVDRRRINFLDVLFYSGDHRATTIIRLHAARVLRFQNGFVGFFVRRRRH